MAGERVIQWTAVPSFPNAIACEKKSVADITPDAFERDYVHRAIPCVLTDVTAEWPCRARWSLDFFAREHGDLEVSVDDGRKEKMRTTMREYIERFEEFARDAEASAARDPAGRPGVPVPYLRTWNFEDDAPELSDGFPHDSPYFRDFFQTLKPTWRPPFTWLFLGPRGAATRLHVDVWHTDAWLTMIRGSKKFVMFHPAHLPLIHDEATGTYVDLHAPDLAKFPRFRDATPIEFTLEEGETVYIPRKWPHYAVALDHGVSLTVNFASAANRRGVVDRCVAYANRRDACEHVLGRTLRASDNAMKFCVHGGEVNKNLAASILGVDADELDRRMRARRLERLRAEAEEAERAEEVEEQEAAVEEAGESVAARAVPA